MKIHSGLSIPIVLILFLQLAAAADRVGAPSDPQPTQPTQGDQTVDDADAGWIWSGMESYSDPALHGATGHAGGPGSYGAYTFHGVSVDVYGFSGPALVIDGRAHKTGNMKISIDDKEVATTSEKGGDNAYEVVLAHVSGLTDGNHVLQVAPDAGWGVVDYIVVHGSTSGAVPLAAAKPLIPDGYYQLVPRNAPDKCLDVTDPACPDGAGLQIYEPAEGHTEVWHIVPLGNERYRISPKSAPSEAISIAELTDALNDPQLVLWHYTGDPRQQILIRPVEDGFFRIGPSSDENETVDVFYNGKDNGNKVIGYAWGGGNNQQWWLAPVSGH